MKGEWKIETKNVGGVKQYAVYRLIDIDLADCYVNREYAVLEIRDKERARFFANNLNKAEVR